jgi:beta-1,4-mannosyl-glycoprotein beta-1,4-N-acetylglucosaminyltransferase
MKIVDNFTYFNEIELLELRIKLLRNHVDKFIIMEGNKTFRGDSKQLTCQQTLEELGLMSDKIRIVQVDLPSKRDVSDDWAREDAQRDVLAPFITDDMVVICSDLDEIMDPDCIKYFATTALQHPNSIFRIPMWWISGRGDLQLTSPNGLSAANMCAFIGLPHHFRTHKVSEIRKSYARQLNNLKYPDAIITENGNYKIAGWHITWMGDRERILKKFNSISSHEGLLHNSPGKGDDAVINDFLKSYVPHNGSTDPLGRSDHILRPFNTELLPKLIWELPRVRKLLFPES